MTDRLFSSGTHVTFGAAAAERLSALGARGVVRSLDNLLLGPSRADPAEHARVRKAWWEEGEEWDELCSPRAGWQVPVVLWVGASLQERVSLWRTCSWLRGRGIVAKDVLVLEFDAAAPGASREEPTAPFDCAASVADHADDVLLDRLASARSWSRWSLERPQTPARGARPWRQTRHDRAVSLWSKYTAEDPRPFVRDCTRGVPGFPELGPLWGFLSCLFPRRTAEGVLRISRFDELLLTLLSAEWQTPVKVFVHESAAGAELRQLASCTGDLFVPQRLEQWVQQGAIERAPGPRPSPDYPMVQSVYRITELGVRLRENGLGALAAAPGLLVGGTEAYAAPWVVLGDGRLVRV